MTEFDCDVVIVGAGLSGSVIARRLVQAGYDVVVLEAGENTGATWADYQSNMTQMLEAPAKVPNSAWSNSPAAPSPSVLDLTDRSKGDPPSTGGYFVQKGAQPFGSDYQRSRGGTTLHWYGHSIRMLPNDFRMRSEYGVGEDWPIGYGDLEPSYEQAEYEIGVAADVEDQVRTGTPFRPGYVYPMHKVPSSYLDRWLGELLDGLPVRIGGEELPTGVVPVPGGRNSVPNPAYDDGRGYTPVGAVGLPASGLRCEGYSSCIPGCPAQAKYNALKTLDVAIRGGARVLTQAVVTRLVLGPDRRVARVAYQRWTGGAAPTAEEHSIRARRYVLAAHAVENAKILLMSEAANSSDQVGRNLMDHPFLLTWALAPEPLGVFRGPGSSSGIETLRDGAFRRQHSSFRVDIDNWGFSILGSPGTDVSAAVFGDGLFGTRLRTTLGHDVQRQVMFGFLLEQLPERTNRVTVSRRLTDALGVPRPVLTYDIGGWTRRGAAVARASARRWFEALGAQDLTDYTGSAARMVAHQSFAVAGEPYRTMGAGHICGTHRMGSHAEHSVVDSHQRSWDHDNLFVVGAGSMVTIGTSNPSLTLTALACRTADELIRDLP
jgi:choline dehydrogenase-like flavoprotein